ncbi:hypothetical protein CONPUDRAFT_162152 [Coniophora puteana RWD-64-598 SS2]|uniref:F-box domain-containing protein n=1 Tax=Coniophora puteana (strain RWD-64-598) TaxID=741705 RepID=A0A5M3N0D2_CONPW|nr:uncharacterized protein CONPUDRAFT_162152 [Coniophora puteana RWD-64-598 SS2]EIW84828.1 hypothetical protein CONPUDRAFT_162152 [Coniophora puteana RWD-64-598 SS2]
MSPILTFDSLPLDVLIKIAEHLDVQDLVRLRQTSKTLFSISYERSPWSQVYSSSHLPRPPGPHPAQSRKALETILSRSMLVHRNMFLKNEPSWTLAYDASTSSSGDPTSVVMLADRWVVVQFRRQTVCVEVDPANVREQLPRRVVWEVDDSREENNLDLLNCRTFYAYDGQMRAFLVLEQCANEREVDEPEVIVLQVHFDEDCQWPRFEATYRTHSRAGQGSLSATVTVSPHVLVVHMIKNRAALVWDVLKAHGQPVTVKDDAFGSEHVYHLPCRTHFLTVVLSTASVEPLVQLVATPLSDTLSGTRRITATGNIEGFWLSEVVLLRDSVVDPGSGVTDVILLGRRYSYDTDRPLMLFRLLIPPHSAAGGAPAEMIIQTQTVAPLPALATDILIDSCTGSTRVAYAIQGVSEEENALGLVEVVYDEEKRSATARGGALFF